MVRAALTRGIHVFCEKPLFLDTRDGAELTALAAQRGLVTQVGYHNRFVGTFAEAKRLLEIGAIGTVTNALAEAYGPVVTKPSKGGWRDQRAAAPMRENSSIRRAGGAGNGSRARRVTDIPPWKRRSGMLPCRTAFSFCRQPLSFGPGPRSSES